MHPLRLRQFILINAVLIFYTVVVIWFLNQYIFTSMLFLLLGAPLSFLINRVSLRSSLNWKNWFGLNDLRKHEEERLGYTFSSTVYSYLWLPVAGTLLVGAFAWFRSSDVMLLNTALPYWYSAGLMLLTIFFINIAIYSSAKQMDLYNIDCFREYIKDRSLFITVFSLVLIIFTLLGSTVLILIRSIF